MILILTISRTRFISEKFLVYLSNTIFIPITAIIITYILHFTINEDFDTLAFIYASLAYWLLFVVLGTISLLMGTVFLDSTRAYVASGIVIIGMWILERISGLVLSLKDFQYLSIFHYINGTSILKNGIESVYIDILLVMVLSILVFVSSIIIFERKDLTTT